MSRFFDVLLTVSLLLLIWPLMVLIALAIRFDSRGPALFRQERVGRQMRHFVLYKFRTMTLDGDPQAISFDNKRITRLGAWLRRSKLDELPQLFNILSGEMSFVGPRPELPIYVMQFEREYAELLRRRPGLTDPAAIDFRDEATILRQSADPARTYVETIVPEKLRLYLEYSRRRTLWSDLGVLGRTFVALFR